VISCSSIQLNPTTTTMDTSASDANTNTAVSKETAEVRVKFFTRIEKYAVPDVPIAVPVRLRRVHLSQMVNHLLQLAETKPFDFLIKGEFLRTDLAKLIESNGMYTEEIIPIEFVETIAPPKPPHDFPHEDWVSSITGRADGYCLTGCYDNAARLWNSSGELVSTLIGHTAPIKDISWIPTQSLDELRCVTASQDEALMLWSINPATRTSTCLNVCTGHQNEVCSVAVQPTGKMFASGSVDRSIRLWSAEPDTNDIEDSKGNRTSKRRKVKVQGSKEEVSIKRPVGRLSGSNGAVHSLAWPTREHLFSSGEDHIIRMWDVEMATTLRLLNSSKVSNCIRYSALNNMIASGDFDGGIRLYDARSEQSNVSKITLASHKQACSSVAWSPDREFQLVSGSYDDEANNAKLWDIRSTRIPIHNIAGPTQKVLAVDWAKPDVILTGGADGQLRMHSWDSSSSD